MQDDTTKLVDETMQDEVFDAPEVESAETAVSKDVLDITPSTEIAHLEPLLVETKEEEEIQ